MKAVDQEKAKRNLVLAAFLAHSRLKLVQVHLRHVGQGRSVYCDRRV
jgi:hypothetical protein